MIGKRIQATAWVPLVLFTAAGAWAGPANERIIRTDSITAKAVTATPSVTARLFGTGAIRWYTDSGCTVDGPATLVRGTVYYVKLVVTAGSGLILSNGDFPLNAPPMHTFPVENYNVQVPSCYAVTAGRSNSLPLTGLTFTSSSGGSMTLSATTYTATRAVFYEHSGSYDHLLASIPEPGTLALLLGGTAGLVLAYRRRKQAK